MIQYIKIFDLNFILKYYYFNKREIIKYSIFYISLIVLMRPSLNYVKKTIINTKLLERNSVQNSHINFCSVIGIVKQIKFGHQNRLNKAQLNVQINYFIRNTEHQRFHDTSLLLSTEFINVCIYGKSLQDTVKKNIYKSDMIYAIGEIKLNPIYIPLTKKYEYIYELSIFENKGRIQFLTQL